MENRKQLIIIMFLMLYNKFIEKCFSKIHQRRQHDFKVKIQVEGFQVPEEPTNIYIQLFCEKNKKLYKLEQWNFITITELIDSEYGEEQDPQLDSLDVSKKSFFTVLDEILANLNPKLLIKMMEPEKVKMKLSHREQELSVFVSQTAYLKEIDQFQTQTYKCKVSLKYDYEENQQVKIMSSEEEFQLLVDESYENDRINQLKEERKMSEDVIRLAGDKTLEEIEVIKEQKLKKKEKIKEIKEMIKATEFEEAGGKSLQEFIKSIQ